MNMINSLKLAGVALVAAASLNAWSQTSDATATTDQSATPSASTGSSKAAARKANRALSKKVAQALQKGGIDVVGINVIAKNGAITLAGHAADGTQIDKAAAIANGVSGVTSVKNVLTIQEGGQ
ncbi:BON domain-containing protein [Caballeronia ptereochthonis]|uniref:Transport-associated protein n=1 Tax=Caballeronia ptereochthonis TaxID=1777144 RepID=A0A158C926_9BURK|nr:BON domain-containing protein [Caballeronia ptereochthonis]SAK78790.1 transport-associated protein [Caballeronia ptereochthonis]